MGAVTALGGGDKNHIRHALHDRAIGIGILDTADGIVFGVENHHGAGDAIEHAHGIAGFGIFFVATKAGKLIHMAVEFREAFGAAQGLHRGQVGDAGLVRLNEALHQFFHHVAAVERMCFFKGFIGVVARAIGKAGAER